MTIVNFSSLMTNVYPQVQVDQADTFPSPANFFGSESSGTHAIDIDIENGDYVRARLTTELFGGGISGDWSAPVRYTKPPDVVDLISDGTTITAAGTTDSVFLHVQIASDPTDLTTVKENFIDFRDAVWSTPRTRRHVPDNLKGFTEVQIYEQQNGRGSLRLQHPDDVEGYTLQMTGSLSFVIPAEHRNGGYQISLNRNQLQALSTHDGTGWIVKTDVYTAAAGTTHVITQDIPIGVHYHGRFTTADDGSGQKGDWTGLRQRIAAPSSLYLPDTNRFQTDETDTAVYFHAQIDYEDVFDGTLPASPVTDHDYAYSGTFEAGAKVRARYTSGPRGSGDASPWTPVLTYQPTTEVLLPSLEFPDDITFTTGPTPGDASLIRVSTSLTIRIVGGAYDTLQVFFWSSDSTVIAPTVSNTVVTGTSKLRTSLTVNEVSLDFHWDETAPAVDRDIDLSFSMTVTGTGTHAPSGSENQLSAHTLQHRP